MVRYPLVDLPAEKGGLKGMLVMHRMVGMGAPKGLFLKNFTALTPNDQVLTDCNSLLSPKK